MKNKIINLIREGGGALMLLVMMLVGVTQAKAQTNYYIRIAGVGITSENCNDLSVIDGVNGTVTFDPETYTLTLDNATIRTENTGYAIDISGLVTSQVTIVLKGENKIMCGKDPHEDYSHICIGTSTIIRGPGTLNLNRIACDVGFMVMDNATINARDIYSVTREKKCTLQVVNSNVYATDSIVVDDFKTIGCSANWPEGVEFDKSKRTFVVNGEKATGIGIENVRTYGFLINEVEVTEKNYNNLNEIEGVSGTVSYNPDTKTLTLDNATIYYPKEKSQIKYDNNQWAYCLRNNRVENFKIDLKGDNKITSYEQHKGAGIVLAKPTTISGEGNLYIKQSRCGILFKDELLIKDCTLDIVVHDYTYGIVGGERINQYSDSNLYKKQNLAINNANVTVKLENNPDWACAERIYSLELENCYIDTPAGAVLDDSLHCIAANGTTTGADYVVIKRIENYGLTIAGVKVTNQNCKDLTVIPAVTKNNENSTASYDPDTKTLTLNDVEIRSNSETIALVNDTVDNLKINVPEGTTSDVVVNYDASFKRTNAIELNRSTTITGGGTLKAFGGTDIVLGAVTLTVDTNTTVKASVKTKDDRFSARLAVKKKGKLTAAGNPAAISNIKGLDLDGVVITYPAGAYYDESLKGVTLDGKTLEKQVVIGYKEFPLSIAGVKVTSENCKDLSVIPCVSGGVEYVPETNTLRLYNATIDFQDEEETYQNAIDIDTDSLTISIYGTNTVFCKYAWALQITGKGLLTTIKGENSNATLNLYHSPDVDWGGGGISIAYNSTLLIDGCYVNTGGNEGIKGSGYSPETSKLIIRNAFVTIEDGIRDIAALTLDGVAILQPSGATFDASKESIVLDGTIVKDKIVIGNLVNYGLEIAGKKVTNANCNDLSVISNVSGTVKYDPETKTLTLDNARIDVIKETPIKNISVSDLVIKVIGENTLDNYFAAIATALPATIKGDGILNILEGSNGIYVAEGTSLLIDSCTVNILGKNSCILGATGEETLTIHNANVKAIGGSNGVISNMASLTLRGGSSIVSPENAWFSSTLKGVAVGNELVKDSVVITFDPNALYDVVLEDFESAALAVKALQKFKEGLKLSEALAIVRQAPCVLFENLSYSEADDIRSEFIGANSTASIWPHGAWGYYLGFKINNVEVTKDNCGDLSVIPGVSGIVKYDTITKTLTLDNATIAATEKGQDGIYVYWLKNLTISATGENNVTSKETYAIEIGRAITINGGGTLNVTSEKGSGMYVGVDDIKDADLFIDSCTVNIKGDWEGIMGENSTLAIRKADVTIEGKVEGDKEGALAGFVSLTLTDCEIAEPAGIKIDNLLYNETPLVIIKKIADEPVGIKDVKENVSARKQGIYSIDGIYLGTDFDALPKGIYIKDGKKVLK